MTNRLTGPFLACAVLFLCSCATTLVKQTWISPDYTGGQVGTVAVLTVEERGMVRTGVENRLARELERGGQSVVRTHEHLSIWEIKDDKDAAAKQLREAGAQTVLITRLVSSEEQAHSVRAGPERYAPVTTGFSSGMPYYGYGWGGYYTLAFQDMSTVWSSQSKMVRLESSLFNLEDGKPLWSCLTETGLKESDDRVAEVDVLADQIISALRTDGLVK